MKQRVWTVSEEHLDGSGWHVVAVFDNEQAATVAAADSTRSGMNPTVTRLPVERDASV